MALTDPQSSNQSDQPEVNPREQLMKRQLAAEKHQNGSLAAGDQAGQDTKKKNKSMKIKTARAATKGAAAIATGGTSLITGAAIGAARKLLKKKDSQTEKNYMDAIIKKAITEPSLVVLVLCAIIILMAVAFILFFIFLCILTIPGLEFVLKWLPGLSEQYINYHLN